MFGRWERRAWRWAGLGLANMPLCFMGFLCVFILLEYPFTSLVVYILLVIEAEVIFEEVNRVF